MNKDTTTHRFTLDSAPRIANRDNVARLDAAATGALGLPFDQLFHMQFGDELRPLRDGGRPLWAVGACTTPDAHLLVSYGLSKAIDPGSPYAHELSLRLPNHGEDRAPIWAAMLLHYLARYQLAGYPQVGIPPAELRVGDFMDLCGPISKVTMPKASQAGMPDTALVAVALLPDSEVTLDEVEVRRVVGLTRAEHDAILENPQALLTQLANRDPSLSTDLTRS